MVQRAKGVGKLGIQADHVKSEKLSTSLKPSGSLHQDGKTKAADCFKRKMKKSRSLSLGGFNPSPPLRKTSPPRPGRPPPTALPPPIVGTPPRQSESPVKARHVLPNYMKSTSSSDARKENSQVSHLQSTPSGSAAKVSRRRCSTGSPRHRLSSGSGKYSPSSNSRTLKRSSSSLKLVRTLTKSPSFKPARSTSAKKCAQIVVCADSSIQKATCSSTLKETKYPEYLMLNPGGTEAEGTSIFKVCPYTYCSLNGHRHAQLPPLKRFVAARRRLLKAQKIAKVAPVSPDSFCRGSLGDKPACIELDFETDFFVEIYAKSEKEGSLNIGGDVCGSEGEDDRSSSPSDEGSCENGDDGLKGDIDLDKNIEYCRDATETEMKSGSDNISREKEETDTRDLDEVYSLIMIQKERICRNRSLSQCDVDEDELFKGVEDLNVCSADSTDDDWDEVDRSSSELDQGEALSMTETEDGHDKDTLEYEEEQKQEDKELHFCNAGLQEDGMDPVSDCSKSNEAVEGVAVVEIGDSAGQCSQIESEVSFEEIDGDDIIGAQTMSTCLILQTEAEEAGASTSQGDACFEPQVDAFPPKDSLTPPKGPAEEIEVTAEPLIYVESIILEEVGLQDEEETGAAEQASDTEIPTKLQIPGTSSEDPGEADRSIPNLEFAPGQENDKSSLLISTTSDGSGDADNLEGVSTGELHISEDHTGQSEKVDGNKAAELSTASFVLNGTTLMSNQPKDRYLRGKGKYREELSDTCMIWRINKREKCDVPDEELRGFNPRDPNYLPIIPDPDAEKVDLRHQMIDDRRNSEEWMIDYVLQRTVSKLAPARKKKVELLVEAFEKVMPVSQFETHIKSSSTGITQGRPIQACS